MLTGLSIAGLILPEGVAYAAIAGLPPGRALAAGIAGGLVYALTGRSRFAIVSSTSSSAAILASAIAVLTIGVSDPGARDALATVLIALAGLLFIILSLFRMGSLSGFISRPVLRGFAFGLAITITVKQLPAIVGVAGVGGSVWAVLVTLIKALSRWNLLSIILGLGAITAILLLRRTPKIPGALMVIVTGIGLSIGFDLAHHGVALAGPITLAMPHLTLPPLALLPRMVQLAAPISLILFAESWGTMRNLALKHGDDLDCNRELGALGFANIASALVQGMPIGAGFSGCVANEMGGATSRLSQASASLALLALALFASHWIALIPEPVLAAIVIAALSHALSPAPLIRLFRIQRDQWIGLAAAIGVLALGVLNGMLVAIGLSIAQFLYHMSHPSISELGQVGDSHDFVDIAHHDDAHRVAGTAIFRPNAPLIFANAESILRVIEDKARQCAPVTDQTDGQRARLIVVSLEESNDLDATAVDALAELEQSLANHGQKLILARAHDQVRDVLAIAGNAALAAASTYSVADAARNVTSSHHTKPPTLPQSC